VIERERESTPCNTQRGQRKSMDNLHDDEHDEDDLPTMAAFVTSMNTLRSTRADYHPSTNDTDLIERFTSPTSSTFIDSRLSTCFVSRSMSMARRFDLDWEQLYRTSLQSLNDDNPSVDIVPNSDTFDRRAQLENISGRSTSVA
jgi:hypothetical protein